MTEERWLEEVSEFTPEDFAWLMNAKTPRPDVEIMTKARYEVIAKYFEDRGNNDNAK